MGVFDIVKGIGQGVFPPLGLAQATKKITEPGPKPFPKTKHQQFEEVQRDLERKYGNGGKNTFKDTVTDIGGTFFPPLGLFGATKKIKDQTGVKTEPGPSGNGEDKKTVTTSKDQPPGTPGPFGAIFPPLGLWQQTEYLKKLKQWEGQPPDVTYEGYSAEELKELLKAGGTTSNGGNGGGAAGLPGLEGLGQGMKVLGQALPILIGVMVFSQIKGLFK